VVISGPALKVPHLVVQQNPAPGTTSFTPLPRLELVGHRYRVRSAVTTEICVVSSLSWAHSNRRRRRPGAVRSIVLRSSVAYCFDVSARSAVLHEVGIAEVVARDPENARFIRSVIRCTAEAEFGPHLRDVVPSSTFSISNQPMPPELIGGIERSRSRVVPLTGVRFFALYFFRSVTRRSEPAVRGISFSSTASRSRLS